MIGGGCGWRGTHGLAADVRYYGKLIRQRAQEMIGHLYPKVQLPGQQGGGEADVVAWIWARTVASPDPAARGAHVPLISTFWLCSKGVNKAWLHPVVDRAANTYRFEIRTGGPVDPKALISGTKSGRGANFRCILSNQPITEDHIKAEGQSGRLGYKLHAVVAKGSRTRLYLPENPIQEQVADVKYPADAPTEELSYNARYLTPPGYGMQRVCDLFTPRQVTALVTLVKLVREVRSDVLKDATSAGHHPRDAEAYANAIMTFLALAVDRCADFNNSLCRWSSSNQKVMNLFGRGAIPIIWDFSEANILGDSVGAWATCNDYVAECVEVLGTRAEPAGSASQVDAATGVQGKLGLLISTDPPYYDNIPYAAISDFFYVWLRRCIGNTDSELFATVLVPKQAELTADASRFEGDHDAAKEHFEEGFRNVFVSLREVMDRRFPLTVYYAFKQEDEEAGSVDEAAAEGNGVDLTTGWETLLEALMSSGFQITATWPVRASQAWRMRRDGIERARLLHCVSLPSASGGCASRGAKRLYGRVETRTTARHSDTSSRATWRLWTSPKRPLVLAWLFFPVTEPCWRATANR